MTYENKSVTADSPLNEAALVQRYFDDKIEYTDSFIRFRYCGASAPNQEPPRPLEDASSEIRKPVRALLLRTHQYGRTSEDSRLWRTLLGGCGPRLPAGTQSDKTVVIEVPYQRRIPVGPLRISSATGATPYPAIPAAVSPRAREYETFMPAANDRAAGQQQPRFHADPAVSRRMGWSSAEQLYGGCETAFNRLERVGPGGVSSDPAWTAEDRWKLIAAVHPEERRCLSPAVPRKLRIFSRTIRRSRRGFGSSFARSATTAICLCQPMQNGAIGQVSARRARTRWGKAQRGPLRVTAQFDAANEGLEVAGPSVTVDGAERQHVPAGDDGRDPQ